MFASLVQQLQTLFTLEVAAVLKSLHDSSGKALIELRGSIPECRAAAKGRMDRLVGDVLASSRTNAAIPKAIGTGGASGKGSSK